VTGLIMVNYKFFGQISASYFSFITFLNES